VKQARWLLLGAVLVAGVGYLIYSATGASAEYYETMAQMRAHPTSQDVRVLGTVQPGVVRTGGGLGIRFVAADGKDTMPVEYSGTVPDIFQPGIKVVVDGHLASDGIFHAKTVEAKCPSRFSSSSPATG
jgi:cytochrome c-type biogenesis protein CcmE